MEHQLRHNLNKQIAMQMLVQELFLIITLEYLWMETGKNKELFVFSSYSM